MVSGLRKTQIALESTRGTPVAAAAMLLGQVTVTPELTLFMGDEEDRYSLALHHRRDTVGQGATLSYNGAASFEQIINFLAMGVKGSVTPTGTGDNKTWTYQPDLDETNEPDSYTFEYGDNYQAYQVAHVMARQIQLTYAMNEPVMLSADLFGRYPAKVSFTGSITAPTVEPLVSNKTKLYIDTSWAGLGGTLISNTLINATVTLPTGIAPVRFADGSLDFSTFGESRRAIDVELQFLHNATGEAMYDLFVSGGRRYIRLFTEGSEIGSTGVNRSLAVDMCVQWTGNPTLLAEYEGFSALTLTGTTYPDTVDTSRDFKFVVVSAESALPEPA